jgi:hypothetical protein
MPEDKVPHQKRRRLAPYPLLLLLTLILTGIPAPLRSEQTEEETAGAHQLIFLPPPEEGVISLGVYDADGRLIRVLKKAAEIDSFKSGLNGLFIDWDGKDASGNPVPVGKHSARGILIGEVSVSGEAYHLNDWVDASGIVRTKQILGTAFLSGKSVCALAETDTGRALLIDPGTGKNRATALPAGTRSVKFDGSHILAIANDRMIQVDPATGGLGEQKQYPDLQDADQWRSKWIILANDQVHSSADDGNQTVTPPNEKLVFCAQLDSSAVVAAQNGKLWKYQDHQFFPIETGETGELLGLSAGKGDTIWLLLQVNSKRILRQVDLSGRRIQELDLPPDLQSARRLCGSREGDELLLETDLNPGQRTIGLRFHNSSAQQSVWEKWLERSIRPFQYFDIKNDQVVASQEKTESAPISIQTAENPLENNAPGNLSLVIIVDDTGAWLASSDGLPLLQVAKTKNVVQTKWAADGTKGLRVFVSDGCTVEEYRVRGLDNLYRFDAGEF